VGKQYIELGREETPLPKGAAAADPPRTRPYIKCRSGGGEKGDVRKRVNSREGGPLGGQERETKKLERTPLRDMRGGKASNALRGRGKKSSKGKSLFVKTQGDRPGDEKGLTCGAPLGIAGRAWGKGKK